MYKKITDFQRVTWF